MIIFHAIRWKNLLSTGNQWTEIKLDSHPSTLFVGDNGAGKSTILDALCFALFNKPYRNINKPLLVNTINTKDCVVELGFSVGKKKYMIRRGIKPNIFEIYMDGAIMNQDAKARDYQEMLERMILKMNYKSFTQIVILGSSSFTPFMQLSAADRRAVIEDLLDIQIFSSMNTIVKDRLMGIKTELGDIKIHLDSVKEKIDLHKKHIADITRNTQGMIDDKNSEIERSKHSMIELHAEVGRLNSRVLELTEEVRDSGTVKKKHQTYITLEAKMDNNKNKIEAEIEFYKENDSCPTCKQDIAKEHKVDRSAECEHKVAAINTGLEELKIQQDAVINRLALIENTNGQINALGRDIANSISSITHTTKYIGILEAEITKLRNHKTVSGETEDQSKKLFEELTYYVERRKTVIDDKTYLDVAATLLKDGGIKTRIIRQYLPIINTLVNKYLSSMDFFVNFTIDEEFRESIKSRHRDEFTYQSFSEGEKQKIDLALLFTWRSVARIKNSVNTNLLVLDETFDSSLDTNGTNSLLHILQTLPENTNVFVISHNDAIHDKFNYSIRFEKKQNFSGIVI